MDSGSEAGMTFNKEENTMGGILGLVIFVLDIVAIVEIVKRSLPTDKKVLWIILVLLLPLVGLILYYLMGRSA